MSDDEYGRRGKRSKFVESDEDYEESDDEDAQYGVCQHCGREDFTSASARARHVDRCAREMWKGVGGAGGGHGDRRGTRRKSGKTYAEREAYYDDLIENIDHPGGYPVDEPVGPVAPPPPITATIVGDTDEYEHAAEAARLDTHAMSPLEMERFPQYTAPPHLPHYLRTRNRILHLWLINCHAELSLDSIMAALPEPKEPLMVTEIFEFLNTQGLINFGVLHDRPRPPVDPSLRKSKIIVIGAGVAGLGVARQLDKFGYDVLVLEGRDRLGGRVHTFRYGDHVAELGGMIVTGLGNGNPIFSLARQVNMKLSPVKGKCPIFDETGTRIPPTEDSTLEGVFNHILEATKSMVQEDLRDKFMSRDLSLAEAFIGVLNVQNRRTLSLQHEQHRHLTEAQRNLLRVTQEIVTQQEVVVGAIQEWLLVNPPNEHGVAPPFNEELLNPANPADKRKIDAHRKLEHANRQLTMLEEEQGKIDLQRRTLAASLPGEYLTNPAKNIINWHIANLEFANATTLNTLSLSNWDQDDAYDFVGPHLLVREGFSALPQALASSLAVQVNSVVQRIEYGPTGARVRYATINAEGQTVQYEVTGDAVVSTIPLGVLKAGAVTFNPPLPPWKQDVIARLGYGLLNKVVLCFPTAFWGELSMETFGYAGTGLVGEFYMFWNVTAATGRPTLVALNSGNAAIAMEQVPDQQIIEKALAVLQIIFKGKEVPLPVATAVTRWGSDQFSMGSYSYVAVGCTGADYDAMAQPVAAHNHGTPTLFFAGEHTCRNYPATVHGAYLSGLREAARIVDSIPAFRPAHS